MVMTKFLALASSNFEERRRPKRTETLEKSEGGRSRGKRAVAVGNREAGWAAAAAAAAD